MTTLQDRLRNQSINVQYTELLMHEAADTIDQATQIIESLVLRLPVGDHATIEARRFLDGLNAELCSGTSATNAVLNGET